MWRCWYLCLWLVPRKGLHQVFHVLHWTAFCKVGVGAQSPGVMKPLTAKDSLWSDDRIPWTQKHSHPLKTWHRQGGTGRSPDGLTCEPAHEVCDACHDLLFRERLHIFRLMTSNPAAQYVAIPDISNQHDNTLPREFREGNRCSCVSGEKFKKKKTFRLVWARWSSSASLSRISASLDSGAPGDPVPRPQHHSSV